MKKILKLFLGFAIVLSVALGAYAIRRNGKADDGDEKKPSVSRGTITEKAVAVGRIEPRLTFHVKSKMSGIVKRCDREVGDPVAPGDVLFEIAPDPMPLERLEGERRVESAQTAFNRADADWRRATEMDQQGLLSASDLDARRESYEQAKITLDQARDNLALIREGRVGNGSGGMESTIRAPAGGTLLERKVNPGDPVVPLTSYQEGTELAAIADMSDMIFKGTVDEIDVGKLSVGLPARIKVGALPSATVTGRLSRIAPQAIEKDGARLFQIEIELDPSETLLRAGYSANADLIIREKKEILLVPERLVLFEGEEQKPFVEVPGDKPKSPPRKVLIETGLSDGLNIEVVSGLAEGDRLFERPPKQIKG